MREKNSQPAIEFKRLFEAAPTPLLVLDLSFEIVAVNEAYLQATMTERDKILGRPMFEVFPNNPNDPQASGVENLRASLENVCRTQKAQTMPIQKYDIRRPDGTFEVRYWSPVNTPVFDEQGQLVQIIHRVQDITQSVEARKRIEELVRQAQRESRNKDQFLAMLGHELRNPMAAISTATYVLKSTEPQSMSGDQLGWGLGIIDRQLEQLTRLVNDLLDVARINEGRIQLQREEVSADEIVERAIEMVRPLIDEREQTLEVHQNDQPCFILADRTRMTQVLANLLNNAAKYTQTGGHIELATSSVDDHVLIEVRDNGQGIDDELLPHVFEMFKQADVSLDRSKGGLGLGLTLVRQLVEMHGGWVEAYSEGAGCGSTFTIGLPQSDESGDSLALTVTGDDHPSISQRVLVVDDNIDAADSLAMLLRVDGHTVEVVHDGESALRAAKAFEPQVVLLDIGLPLLDGYEVARRMRQMDEVEDAVLVAITGYGQDSDRGRSEEAGFAYHLVKPINHNRLRQVLTWIDDA